MHKDELLEIIKEYHQNKGLGRKILPFYSSVSRGMNGLIQFANTLRDGEIVGSSLLELYQILQEEFRQKDDICQLTNDIFVKVRLMILSDYLKLRVSQIK